MTTPRDLAILFHDTYERLAPEFGYATREVQAANYDMLMVDVDE